MSDKDRSIFEQIIAGEAPADVVMNTSDVIAFRDINPVAPVHILVVPKRKIVDLADATGGDVELLGKLFLAARQIAQELELLDGGYRLVVNEGRDAGKMVDHLHVHLLAGRPFNWPPG
jgi:histidine triad (HIT) family protein